MLKSSPNGLRGLAWELVHLGVYAYGVIRIMLDLGAWVAS